MSPKVRTQTPGRVSSTLEKIADAYRNEHPQMEPRWIYDPAHKPELSGTTGRLAMGYQSVTWGELAGTPLPRPPKAGDDDPVRVADVVLMAISSEEKREIERENAERAAEQLRSVDRDYYEAIESLGDNLAEVHKPRPRGRAVIEEREFSFDYEQKEGGAE